MKLTANRWAQWLVYGDHYSLQLEENGLLLESRHHRQYIPFSAWDGELTISRGLLWGTISLTGYTQDGEPRPFDVFGLPWHHAQQAGQTIYRQYQAYITRYQKRLAMIRPCLLAEFDALVNAPGYVRVAQLRTAQQTVLNKLEGEGISASFLANLDESLATTLAPVLQADSSWLKARNQQWQAAMLNLWQTWFDRIESSPLNDGQRAAVLTDESHTLVVAGPGSGKTSVLVARAAYLIESGQAKPEQLLLLAFGRDAAEELKTRIKTKTGHEVNVTTFHGFARQQLAEHEGKAPVISPLARDDTAKAAWLTQTLAEHWQQSSTRKAWDKLHQQHALPLDDNAELSACAHENRLHAWIWSRLSRVIQANTTKRALTDRLASFDEQSALKNELAVIWPLYQAYKQALKAEQAVDFDGLIVKATKLFQQRKFVTPIQFVMVDEYQDISPARLAMLEALCHGKTDSETQSPRASLYAVGDDWQAIYRFAGADVSLTTEFAQRFGDSEICWLTTCYRYPSTLGDVAQQFIGQNPKQLSKQLDYARDKASAKTPKTLKMITDDKLEKTLASLEKKHAKAAQAVSVMLIGRTHAIRPDALESWQNAYPSLALRYTTAHASKGQEAHYVFILDMDDGVFPAKPRSLSLDEALLGKNEDPIEHAEERRLFYVALTRAQKQVWLVHQKGHASSFVEELKGYL
ncbi:DNA helicase IV [Salinivibrio sp. ES.052]|uniref:DNA helicase IV n=1 Tax=Salinivibrio sp. ES.052 TaxID=1882823 RepID=UPI000927C2EB|nr:DNA helicase IV [Salinivibrio sp. ES.052]SIN89994.1 DNA helicase-4 [Salinivibrio sp. ES.052]